MAFLYSVVNTIVDQSSATEHNHDIFSDSLSSVKQYNTDLPKIMKHCHVPPKQGLP